jgi:hypothetical protein
MTFAVGTLATWKLMRDEVQPFFVKAHQTGDPETTHTFQMVNNDVFSQAAECSRTIMFLMQVFGDPLYEQRFHKSSRDDAFESVGSILSLSVATELMPIPQIMNSWDSETRVVVESG